MNADIILREIESLPQDLKDRVYDFIKLLKETSKQSNKVKTSTRNEFFGIWKDHQSMPDPDQWLRNVRKSEFEN